MIFAKRFQHPRLIWLEKTSDFPLITAGSLVATNSGGELNAEQMKRATQLMNQSSTLKNFANDYAQLSIDYVNEERGIGFGGYQLDMASFEKTLDIGALIKQARIAQEKASPFDLMMSWWNQIVSKG